MYQAEQEKFQVAARDAILAKTLRGNYPSQIFDRRAGQFIDWRPPTSGQRLASLRGLGEEVAIRCGLDAGQVRNLPNASLGRLIMGSRPSDVGLSASSDGAAYHVSGMFSNILLDAAHVSVRQSYDDSRTTFQTWMKQAPSLTDFLPSSVGILGEFSDPKAIPENGEFEQTQVLDGKEQWQLTVWGQAFSLSWQAFVNGADTLGPFAEIPAKLGGSMRRKQNRLAYGVLKDNSYMADGGALFNSTAQTTAGGHNNLATGAGPPSVTTLNALTKKMMEMRGLNTDEGAALNIMPRWIIGPPALRGTILELLGSFANPAAGGSAAGSSGVKNIWENGLDPIIEGELSASASGGSDTAWYLGSDHMECETIRYAYLEGLEFPAIETESAFGHLAMKWRIFQAFAVAPGDYRGLQKHAGA